MKCQKIYTRLCLALVFCVVCGMSSLPLAVEAQTQVSIICPEGSPAEFMKELAALYATENDAELTVLQYPWAEYQSIVTDVWTNQKDTLDLILGDSQWMGTAVSQGHYVDLTDFVARVKDRFTDQSIAYYSEYPQGSGRYYGIPCESDALGFAYRKDLFEDPAEMAAFQAKYGRVLQVPTTWSEFRDVAEFFTRPSNNLYGAAMMYSRSYDYITMIFQPLLWSFGGDWSGPNQQIEGVVNSPESVKALTFLIDLLQFNPPNALNFSEVETMASFAKGESAMCQDWFGFMPLLNSEYNPYKDQTGYFVLPGETQRYISLGGQGISLSAYSTHQEAAMNFLEWFVKDETQLKWAQLGGLSSNKSAIASEDFLQAEPFNEAFMQSLSFVKDFYNVPEYNELLTITQTHLYAAAEGTLSPQAALDAIAEDHIRILSQGSSATHWDLY